MSEMPPIVPHTCRIGHELRVMPLSQNLVAIYCPCPCGSHRAHWGIHLNSFLFQLATSPEHHHQHLPRNHLHLPHRQAHILVHGHRHTHDSHMASRRIDLKEYRNLMETAYDEEEEIDR